MTPEEQKRLLSEYRAAWRKLSIWKRPVYAFQTAYQRGLFWAEVQAGLLALAIFFPAFQNVQGWPLDAQNTRIMLGAILVFHLSQLFLLHPYSRWVRLAANALASSWWCGCAAIMYAIDQPNIAAFCFVTFAMLFLSFVNLSGSKL